MLWSWSNRYLARLHAPTSPAERLQLESVLAVARFALGILSLLALRLDQSEPAQFANLVLILLSLWTFYSAGIIVWLRARGAGPRMGLFAVICDVAWPALFSIFTHGPSSPLFALYVFAVIGAAFRWGLPETMLVTGATVALNLSEVFILTGTTKPFHELQIGEFEINRLIVRMAFLFVMGYLMGKLGENDKIRRAEGLMLNRVLRAARVEHGMMASLKAVFAEALRAFEADQPYFVAQDVGTHRTFLWHGQNAGDPSSDSFTTERAEYARLLMSDWPQSFHAEKLRDGRTLLRFLDGGTMRRATVSRFPELPAHQGEIRSMLCASSTLGEEWSFRVILINAKLGPEAGRELRFAENLLRQSAAALYSVYMVRRLRSRAGAMERARVAREIHDGAIQSLISAEMRVDVLRRRAETQSPPMANELSGIQEVLRGEVLSLRDLMQQMRPVDLGPQQLVDFLADTVERFRRDSGISARFVSDVDEDVNLTPHMCRELVRITQEALVNVRKHAHASNVLVRFVSTDEGSWQLSISDDGRGFDFSGMVEYKDLLSSPRGPTVIKERVLTIGGELSIESNPGHGACLRITLRQKGIGSHGR